mmetsp:Transcript_17049/g.24308  ORF Transcript_17049/g.24308 Transcript_17049/m.24308 type:complete len:214 (+) Transcript_17049:1984-2625(+)
MFSHIVMAERILSSTKSICLEFEFAFAASLFFELPFGVTTTINGSTCLELDFGLTADMKGSFTRTGFALGVGAVINNSFAEISVTFVSDNSESVELLMPNSFPIYFLVVLKKSESEERELLINNKFDDISATFVDEKSELADSELRIVLISREQLSLVSHFEISSNISWLFSAVSRKFRSVLRTTFFSCSSYLLRRLFTSASACICVCPLIYA